MQLSRCDPPGIMQFHSSILKRFDKAAAISSGSSFPKNAVRCYGGSMGSSSEPLHVTPLHIVSLLRNRLTRFPCICGLNVSKWSSRLNPIAFSWVLPSMTSYLFWYTIRISTPWISIFILVLRKVLVMDISFFWRTVNSSGFFAVSITADSSCNNHLLHFRIHVAKKYSRVQYSKLEYSSRNWSTVEYNEVQ